MDNMKERRKNIMLILGIAITTVLPPIYERFIYYLIMIMKEIPEVKTFDATIYYIGKCVLSVFSIMSDGESPKDKNRKISER
ncbi:hypothetical protein H8356DRAFT_1360532 [Neocallimastix lanati (nom. inval.)]|nr:hypothetical protein H8356DRAFT_1360532 [Neocallimastix sp. JGI-2020a]